MLGMHPEKSKLTRRVPITLFMKLPPGDPHNLIPGWFSATWSLETQVVKPTHTEIRIRAAGKGFHIRRERGFPRRGRRGESEERRVHKSRGRTHRSGGGQG